jgi:AcrR family transcriptional regulator
MGRNPRGKPSADRARTVAERRRAAPTHPVSLRPAQRARLLRAIVEVVTADGYPDAKVGDITSRAGVSRATFYEMFTGKEACLLAAQHELAGRLGDELAEAITHSEPGRGTQAALVSLVEFADREPLAFDFLMHQTMLGGPQAVTEHDRLFSHIERMVEQSWEQAPECGPLLDMSARILLEGAARLLGVRVRRDGDSPRQQLGDLLAWVDAYTVNAGPPRWRELVPHPALASLACERPGAPVPVRSLPKGRHRLAAELVRQVQRERIVYATVQAIRAKGYASITVADIVAAAGVSRDVFYANFHDKQEAFEAAIQVVFEQLLATMAGAFFGSSGGWPEQVWQAGQAFAGFLEGDASLAHFLFVGTYAPPAHINRVHDFVLAFTVFVEYGNRCRPQGAQIPRVVSEAIVCSVLEAVTFQIRHDRVEDLRGLVPVITYMVFAPFIGTDRAREFVEAKITAAQIEGGAGSAADR